VAVVATLEPGSRAAARGWSDLTIRNMFILPTIAFLIVFNIFPLLYSLGYSFTDFRASVNAPASFVGLQNYRDLLNDPERLAELHRHRPLRHHLGRRPGAGRLRYRAAPQPQVRVQGLITTLLLLPMMMSMAVVGLFWKLLYDPSWGPINYALGIGKFDWLSNPHNALYAMAITDIWMWAPFVMLLSLAGLSAVPQHLYEAAAIDRAGSWYTFTRITLPLVAPILLIAIIFRTMEAFKTFDLPFIMSGQAGHRDDRRQALPDGLPGMADRALLGARLHRADRRALRSPTST
jgi:multiple sugar transport system permease protein